MKLLKINAVAFVSLLLCAACNDNTTFPHEYIGFEKNIYIHKYDTNDEKEIINLEIIAQSKSSKDRKLNVFTNERGDAVSLKDNHLTINKGEKKVIITLFIYPKKLLFGKRIIKIICHPENSEIKESELYIRLEKKTE